jgi:c(7)-type cytochrome triheme protein
MLTTLKRCRILAISLALAAFVLVPAAVLGLSVPDSVRIPVVEAREAPTAALFSHWAHNQYSCYACHPSLFPTKKKAFTHADIASGKYCGACHDGKRAWRIADIECELCHVDD